jgi:alpha-beta hydrolase superfamily lysophospholipase
MDILLHFFKLFLLAFIIFYFIIFFLVKYYQDRLIFFPSKNIEHTPLDFNLEYWNIDIKTKDGNKLCGWFIPERESRKVIIFCHGNAGNISHYIEKAVFFKSMGYSALLYDYRGYGESTGKSDNINICTDIDYIIEHVTQILNIKKENIIVWGWSLGGVPAAYAGSAYRLKGIVLESTFTSIKDTASRLYPALFFLTKRIIRDYNNIFHAQNQKTPVLSIHSPEDEIIPFELGKKLFEKISSEKTFLAISGSHNEGFYVSKDKIKAKFISFFEK